MREDIMKEAGIIVLVTVTHRPSGGMVQRAFETRAQAEDWLEFMHIGGQELVKMEDILMGY